MRSVERGRWKFVRSASTTRNSAPGTRKRRVWNGPADDLPAVLAGGGLERSHARRPDGDDPPPLRLRPPDGLGRLHGHEASLRVHPVLLDDFDLHRLERADPDVERHRGHLDAAAAERLEELGAQVQAGGRGGDRPGLPGVDGLVVLGVARVGDAPFAVDVRGSGVVPTRGSASSRGVPEKATL